jgi:hypothetical protein
MHDWSVCSAPLIVFSSLRAAGAQKGVFGRACAEGSLNRARRTPICRSQTQTDSQERSLGFDTTLEGHRE